MIVGLAILGSIGWAMWRLSTQFGVMKSTTQTATSDPKQAEEKTADEQKPATTTYAYSIDEWGLGSTEAAGMDGITYHIGKQGDVDFVYFSKDIDNLPCGLAAISKYSPDTAVFDLPAGSTGTLAKDYTPPEDLASYWRKMGNFYYQYTGTLQAVCGNDDGKEQLESVGAVRKMFENLKEK